MRINLLFLSVLCIAFIAGVQSSSRANCSPGETWMDKCRSCRCSRNGTPICSRIICPGDQGALKPSLPPLLPEEDEKTCVDGEVWMEDCNRCHCSGGNIACTRKLCDRAPPQQQVCMPGTTVPAADGCNTCSCGPDGTVSGCTEMACISAQSIIKRIARHTECTPGTTIPAGDGCNFCFCTSEGKIGGCTLKGCVPPNFNNLRSIRSTECSPGTEIPAGDGCNTCFCGPNGKIGGCTLMACITKDELNIKRNKREKIVQSPQMA